LIFFTLFTASLFFERNNDHLKRLAVEKGLIKHFPEELIHKAHHWRILHGRYTCLARNPKCDQCGLQEICKYCQKTVSEK